MLGNGTILNTMLINWTIYVDKLNNMLINWTICWAFNNMMRNLIICWVGHWTTCCEIERCVVQLTMCYESAMLKNIYLYCKIYRWVSRLFDILRIFMKKHCQTLWDTAMLVWVALPMRIGGDRVIDAETNRGQWK